MFKTRRRIVVHVILALIGAPCLWLYWSQYTSPIKVFAGVSLPIKSLAVLLLAEIRRQVFFFMAHVDFLLPKFGIVDIPRGLKITLIDELALTFVSVPAALTIFFIATQFIDLKGAVLATGLFWAAFLYISASLENKPGFWYLLIKGCFCITEVLLFLYSGSIWFAVLSSLWHRTYRNFQLAALIRKSQQID